jgi:hypothetical protein
LVDHGVSLRVFLVHDDDSIHRIPVSRFIRLKDGDRKECFPAYAGKRIRYALTAVDLLDRKPVSFLHTEYGFLHFDSDGFIDVGDQQKEDRMGAEMIDLKLESLLSPKIVHAQDRFARKRYFDKHRWTPTEALESTIIVTAWGVNLDDQKKAKDIASRKLHAVGKKNEVKAKYTHQQGQYLAYIYYYTKIHGYAPSEADMQRYFRVSPPSVHQMIVTLEKRGFIKKVPGQARSISLLVPRAELPNLE